MYVETITLLLYALMSSQVTSIDSSRQVELIPSIVTPIFSSADDVPGPPHHPGGGAGVQPSRAQHGGWSVMERGKKCIFYFDMKYICRAKSIVSTMIRSSAVGLQIFVCFHSDQRPAVA